jgi:CRISPR/Cas system-associated exonuclease Cas4 (RecB family)
MSIIRSALNDYALSRQKNWTTDRSQTVGASEIGQCSRKVFWLKNENDPHYAAPRDPDYVDTWGARERGTVFENHFWEPALRSQYGDRLLFAGSDQQTFVSGFLSATPDGLLTGLKPNEIAPNSGSEVMVECKTADPRTNLNEAKPENVFQTQVQMGIIWDQTDFRPMHSVLSYTDASFWSEGKEFIIPFTPKVYETAQKRAAEIMTATNAADLKPEGWIAGGKECDYCPFTQACGRQRKTVPADGGVADPQFVAEIADLARQLKFAERSAELSEKQVREAQEEIKTRMRAKGLRRLVGDGVSVSWSSMKGRETYDNKAIREAAAEVGIDVEGMKNTGEPSDRLVITVSKPDGAEKSQARHSAAA